MRLEVLLQLPVAVEAALPKPHLTGMEATSLWEKPAGRALVALPGAAVAQGHSPGAGVKPCKAGHLLSPGREVAEGW